MCPCCGYVPHQLLTEEDPQRGPRLLYLVFTFPMPTVLQLTIEGKTEFIPPRINLHTFLDTVLRTKPDLLDPRVHSSLMMEFARFAGLKPDEWGISLTAIRWLLERSPDVERACRKYRANAY